MMILDILCALAGLTCVFLAGRGSTRNFLVGYVYCILLFIMFAQKHVYANLILQPISLIINIIGHYRWTHPRKNESSDGNLKITFLSWTQRIVVIASVLILGAFWGWFLEKLGTSWFSGIFSPDPVPYLDSCLTMLILMAQYLSALKKWDCWIAWLVVNVVQIALHLNIDNFFMPIVSGLYLINGVVSLVKWYRDSRNNS